MTLDARRRVIRDVVQTLKFAAERNLRIKSADAGATANAEAACCNALSRRAQQSMQIASPTRQTFSSQAPLR
ncbi:hypothetical protein [Xanthomonas hortorum]|uniref:Uncharacterized protein n=1 Tax=Xanthomonas hortorum pv. pelargonii TaxID=453602 RepID=A0AAW9ZP84_9XANT|nr:hypothetical protein [Xanthomonas hortorum]MCE4352472.1 hypothetical protein [Xanthomonas hortorum pv. pelargonii]MCM5525715.1 hypothetical protein [Xanthomonas hortorum pv. pelargonii]MCM5534974.1 hypothetical protein [Xanthomonas hortorum pv. pelargonii]MCM5539144.1 hypothetical protein [Xanthomonas hortorum pv. pelargonii]MCM5546883.1 hypothetical protein [Xanthomonas hortorum pv. pelargonii]